jgi:hypothetical protein
MRRRDLITLGGAAAAWPVAVRVSMRLSNPNANPVGSYMPVPYGSKTSWLAYRF